MNSPSSEGKKRKKEPTKADLLFETQLLFENAGSEVETINVASESESISLLDQAAAKIDPGVDWDDQTKAMQVVMGLINGGALEYDPFRKNLIQLYSGLVAAATNLRSALVKQSCLVIAQLSRELGNSFDSLGDYITPLSTQLSHGTQIIAESCRLAIICIARYVQSRKTMTYLFDLAQKKGVASKACAAECFSFVTNEWNSDLIRNSWTKFSETLKLLLSDASLETRKYARIAVTYLKYTAPDLADSLISTLDRRAQLSLDEPAVSSTPYLPIVKPKPPSVASEKPEFNFHGSPRIQSADKTKSRKKITLPEAEEPPQSSKNEKVPKLISKIQTRKIVEPKPRKTNVIDTHLNPRQETKSRQVLQKKYSYEPKKRIVSTPSPREEVVEQPQKQRVGQVASRRVAQSKSYAPQAHKEELVAYSDGHEKEFLNSVQTFIDSNRIDELESSIPQIALGAAKCCTHHSPQISLAAFKIFQVIIPMYPSSFSTSLPKLIPLFLNVVEASRSAPIALDILLKLSQSFDCNQLLSIAVKQKPTSVLNKFLESLVRNDGICLTDDDICIVILDNAYKFHSSNDLNNRHVSANIIGHVDGMNHSAVIKYYESLKPKDQKEFSTFTQSYIPEVTLSENDTEIPHHASLPFPQYRKAIMDIINSSSSNDWIQIRSKVMEELKSALDNHVNDKEMIKIIKQMFDKHGASEIHRILPPLLQLNDQSIYDILMQKCSKTELIVALQQQFDSDSAKKSLDMVSQIISNIDQQSLMKILQPLTTSLSSAINSNTVEIRQAAVNVYVQIKLVIDDQADPVISSLTPQQQKLVSVYYNRMKRK